MLADAVMVETGGEALLRELQMRLPGPAVIVVTGYVTDMDIGALQTAGLASETLRRYATCRTTSVSTASAVCGIG